MFELSIDVLNTVEHSQIAKVTSFFVSVSEECSLFASDWLRFQTETSDWMRRNKHGGLRL